MTFIDIIKRTIKANDKELNIDQISGLDKVLVNNEEEYRASIIEEGKVSDRLLRAKKNLNEMENELLLGRKLQFIDVKQRTDFRERLVLQIDNQKRLIKYLEQKVVNEVEKRERMLINNPNN